MILPMTRPTASSRVVLIADRRADRVLGGGASVRRYRLARLRLEGRPGGADDRFEHLKRVYE
jgi:hypothetical protein